MTTPDQSVRERLVKALDEFTLIPEDASDAILAEFPQLAEPDEYENLSIVNGWLVENTGKHTCGGSDTDWPYAHEPGCGQEPVLPLFDLPGWPEPAQPVTVETVEGFNSDYPVGTRVRFWPGVRDGAGRESFTTSPAWELCGAPVVKVAGYPGGIALTHIKALPATARPEQVVRAEALREARDMLAKSPAVTIAGPGGALELLDARADAIEGGV